jgi:hypothetical protein
MTYKETLFFVGKCLTISHELENRNAIEEVLQAGTMDWEAVVKVSTAHYVFPALYLNLKRADFLQYLPEDLVDYMVHITELNRERNLQIIAQAKEINALLLANGITPIFLKGTGNLLEGLYGDIGERMVGDIDFVVENDFFLEAATLLQEHGYVSKDNLNRNIHWHYPGLVHPEKIASVEVHQKILKDDYQLRLELTLFDDVLTIGSELHVLSHKNKLFAATLPKIINDNLYYNKTISLRNAYDVFLLSQQNGMDISDIRHSKTQRKLTNYLSAMKLLFNHTDAILVLENKESALYLKGFDKLLDRNRLEQRKVGLIDVLVKHKNRIDILKHSFRNETYRKYVLKRIFQWDFYRRLFVSL